MLLHLSRRVWALMAILSGIISLMSFAASIPPQGALLNLSKWWDAIGLSEISRHLQFFSNVDPIVSHLSFGFFCF